MKITGRVETEVVTDVKCDICRLSTRVDVGGLQFATLNAKWGFGTKHDGERYEFHLCEGCFFGTIAYFRQDGEYMMYWMKATKPLPLMILA